MTLGIFVFFLIFCEPCIYYFFYTGTYDVKFKDGFKLEVDYEDLRPVKVCLLKPALHVSTSAFLQIFLSLIQPIQKGFIKFREPLKLEDESSPSNPTGSGSISKEDEKGKESKRQSSSKGKENPLLLNSREL